MYTLKRFQGEALNEILGHILDLKQSHANRKFIVLDSPTGSGKTLITLTAICRELRKDPENRDFDTVLILTPSRDIREGFKIGKVQLPDEGNAVGGTIDGTHMTKALSPNELKWVAEIKLHLTERRKGFKGSVLVATHAAGVRFFKEANLDEIRWNRVLLVIDEAHHVSVDYSRDNDSDSDPPDEVTFEETKIGRLCKEAADRGAIILMASATAFRADRMEQVYPTDARLIKIPYSVYVEELGAPSLLHIDLVGPKDEFALRDFVASTEQRWLGSNSSYHDNQGEEDPKNLEGEISEEDAMRLARRVLKDGTGPDGKPSSKSFIKVNRVWKTLQDGTKVPTKNVERIRAALETVWPGVRIVDGTANNEAEFLRKLDEERKIESYTDSQVDVFIVCGRAKEGTDWKFCSHFYYIGLIGNIPFMIQILGRTTRSKNIIPGYPEHLRDHATLTMFVPTMNENLESKVREKWHAGSLLAACFIHSYDVARQFMDSVMLRIRTHTGHLRQSNSTRWLRLMSRLNHAFPTQEEFAKGVQAIGVLEAQFQARENRNPTIPEVIQELMGTTHPLRVKTAAVLYEVGAYAKDKTTEGDVEQAVQLFVDTLLCVSPKKQVEQDPDPDLYSQYLLGAFQTVAERWGHITSMQLQDLLEVESQIRGKDLPEISADFFATLIPIPPYPQVVRVVEQWYEEKGDCGMHICGDLSSYLGRPAGTYSGATLRRHLRERAIPEQPDEVRCLQDLLKFEAIGPGGWG